MLFFISSKSHSQESFIITSELLEIIPNEHLSFLEGFDETASFDTLNRILTLPLFKQQSGDVYDMLIAHECAHALWTPSDGWKSIADDKELRTTLGLNGYKAYKMNYAWELQEEKLLNLYKKL